MLRHFLHLSIVAQLLSCSRALTIPRQLALTFPDPNSDPFYDQESNIDSFAPGQVISTRALPLVSVATPVPLPLVSTVVPLLNLSAGIGTATHLKYRSVDNSNRSISNVATFFPAPNPVQPQVILSLQFAEDSLNIACAASYGFANLVAFPGDRPTLLASAEIISWALLNGYHVVVPDHEGPSSTWLVGRTEAQMTLDAIRAAINFSKLNASTTPVALHGYSGAGHATEWAASLSSSYAPELNIVGSAAGGIPVDLGNSLEYINGGYVAGLAAAATFGMAMGWPELLQEFTSGVGNFTTTGLQAYNVLRSIDTCVPSKAMSYAFINVNSYFNTPPMNNPVLQSVLSRETLLMSKSSIGVAVPTFPRFIYHSYLDEVIPIVPVAQYVHEQCQNGANIHYEDVLIPEHVVTAAVMTPAVMAFLTRAFSGTTQNCTCGTRVCGF